MNAPSTAEYQRHRSTILRGLSRALVLKTARDLMRENQRTSKKRYSRRTKQALGAA